jgi:hypothetical protein
MSKNGKLLTLLLALLVLGPPVSGSGQKLREGKAVKEKIAVTASPRLWREPTDIATRDLYYGPGGKEHQPVTGYTFIKEDLNGTSPKFEVDDRDGVKWKVKLGVEAQPETVATRLVWAVGYTTSEAYFIPEMHVDGLMGMKRGKNLIGKDGTVHNVRVKRNPEGKKEGDWMWSDNPFTGTRELNGLRVVMALINNWDLKDINNGIFEAKKGEQAFYEVSDLGASFGAPGLSFPFSRSKGNLDAYTHSRFITKETADYVDLGTPSRPACIYLLVKPGEFFGRLHMRWIGHRVPRADAKWMGELLAQLSPQQIQDAFRAAGYTPEQVAAFSDVVNKRITELKRL